MCERRNGDTGRKPRLLDFEGGKTRCCRTLFECAACSLGRFKRRLTSVTQSGRFGGEDFFRFVQLRALKRFEPRNLRVRQFGEQPKKAPDIAVLGVAPE